MYFLIFRLHFLIIITSCKQKSIPIKIQSSLASLKHKTERKIDHLDKKVHELMTKYKVPGVNIAIIENEQSNKVYNYGVLQKGNTEKVNDDTMFSVGSISKVVSAILTLKLVKAGKLKLDEDINTYLTDWKVVQNQFTKNNPVTLRLILSHTAGFSVHGFDDYYPGEKLPTTLEILKGTTPAKSKKVALIFKPGSKFKYSGGGFTVLQKIIENVTGLPYHKAASKILFEPLNLKRMTFENPLPNYFGNIAKAHDENGNPVALPIGYQSMPETAASGLWTTATDLTELINKLLESKESELSAFLTPQLIEDMVTKEKHSEHGLGPYISLTKYGKIVEHRGDNDSYRAVFTLFWEQQKGYVILTNGSNGYKLRNELGRFLEQNYLNLKTIIKA